MAGREKDKQTLRGMLAKGQDLERILSSFPELEDADRIKARITEASRYIPLDNLALSPQCGFASTEEGNILTEEDQWNKVKHIVKIAENVWTNN